MSIQIQEISAIFISQNRLVEGKDYVRAEWLKKSGLARIDIPTNFNMVDSVTTYFKHYGGTTGQMPVFGGNKTHALLWKLWENSSTDKGNRLDTFFNSQFYFDISAKEGKFKVKFNWQTKKRLISWNDVNKAGWLNCALDKTNTKISVLDARMFTAHWHTHTGALAMKYFFLAPNIYLYPCQLLQDIPATLDANGIARTAGECGMVDSISGKFYGNVASSGSFSVEGLDESSTIEDTRLHQIYTNKLVEGKDYMLGEMLKGTGGCYIDTLINPAWNDQLSATTEVSGRPTVQNPNILFANGTNAKIGIILGGDWYKNNVPQCLVIHKVAGTDDYFNAKRFPANAELYVSFKVVNNFRPTVTFKVNGKVWTMVAINGTNIITELPNATYKIGRDTENGLDVLNLKNIKINSHNFVPCRLLCSIPRNLDAQCKSRVVGECGMIDLISGRFYGNVASSGAFSLAWDEWLKDCSIQFDANYLGWTMQYPPTITYKGRVRVANLPDELTDFGFVKLSKTQVVMGENVWSFNNWGSGTWASFDVSYGGGYGCGCSINGSSVGSQQEQVATELSCSIDLQDIIQINKIEFIAYIDQQTTHTVKFTRGFDETLNKQYLISDYDNTRIYAD